MTVREYIGARYIPLFAGEWDNTKSYESLSIVTYQGDSYTSVKAVPIGVDILNTDYWAETGNFNSQVEAYRNEVLDFDARITALEQIDYPLSIANGGTGAATKQNAKANLGLGTAAMDVEFGATSGSKTAFSIGSIVKNSNNAELLDKRTLLTPMNDGLRFYNNTDSEIVWDIKPYARKKALLFGDSYLREIEDFRIGWGRGFAAESGFEIVRRYRSGGAGWVQLGVNDSETGMNFVDMINQAVSDYNEIERMDIDYIVVSGGYNDISHSIPQDTIVAAINMFTNTARTSFPNAKIVVSFAMCSKAYEQSATARYMNDYMIEYAKDGVMYAKNSNSWFIGREDTYDSGDGIHPNDSGLYFMGYLLARVANGDTDVANLVVFSTTKIHDAIVSQYPTFDTWGELITNGTNIVLQNNVYQICVAINIKSAANIPETEDANKAAYIPVCSYLATGFASNAYVNNPGDRTYVRPNAAARTNAVRQCGVGPSNVYIQLTPQTYVSSGETLTYTDNTRVYYQFTMPLA